MKRFLVVVAVVMVVGTPLFAQMPNGAHFNLNIIGVENPKNASMTDSNRHTIFVALGKDGVARTDIWLTPGADFTVCDGNGFDAATDCNGDTVGRGLPGAVFSLPCNTNLPDDQAGGLVPCSGANPTLSYEVWLRELGKPHGTATMTTCAYNDLGERICSSEQVVLVRLNGKGYKPTFRDVTKELTSLIADIDGDLMPERVALFEGGLEDWLWQYDNNGLKLAQLRFYATP
jgi:hypothetical protein